MPGAIQDVSSEAAGSAEHHRNEAKRKNNIERVLELLSLSRIREEDLDLWPYSGKEESLPEDMRRQEAHYIRKGHRADLHMERFVHERRSAHQGRLLPPLAVVALRRRRRRRRASIWQVGPEQGACDQTVYTNACVAKKELAHVKTKAIAAPPKDHKHSRRQLETCDQIRHGASLTVAKQLRKLKARHLDKGPCNAQQEIPADGQILVVSVTARNSQESALIVSPFSKFDTGRRRFIGFVMNRSFSPNEPTAVGQIGGK